jgi:hypothetical protein
MTMDEQAAATNVVESLRKGIPPQRGVSLYSVGNEKLIDGVKKFHLSGIESRGIIRFVSGSWGAGKTHFFRRLRELALENDCLVSTVELDVNSAALNKFESVFAAIVKQIVTPSHFMRSTPVEAAPFGTVAREALAWLGSGQRELSGPLTSEQYYKAGERLMADQSMDIDFKKMVQEYWKTFLPESADPMQIEQTRGEILQWFSGEGVVAPYRKRFGVSKVVSKDNAKLMLQSLAAFVRLSGYRGLVILFDEAEQAYSVMRKSQLKDAHNNLLSIINNIDGLPGLFMIYATTPDFFTDPKHGIVTYGALSGRIGKPEDRPARALDNVWNLDAVETTLEEYQQAANKILGIYAKAFPEATAALPASTSVANRVAELSQLHPNLAAVRFWRVVVAAMIADFDDHLEGEHRETDRLYDDVMDRLRED